MKTGMGAVIVLLLFLVDAFSFADARFIESYNAAVRNSRSHVTMNTKVNDGVLPGKDVVGDNNLTRSQRGSGHEIGEKKTVPSHTRKKKDRGMAFHPLGHSPGIGHDDPPGRG